MLFQYSINFLMEKQNLCPPANSNFTVQELYNIRERNYDWESFKYMLPKKYAHNSSSNLRSGSMFCTKKNYLDDLQQAKKKIPGPSQYSYSTNCLRPESGKMDKAKRLTISAEVKQKCEKENLPGPGAYFKRSKSANPSSQAASSASKREKNPPPKTHYLTEVQYLAAISPGVGMYNLSSPSHIGGPKLFRKVRGEPRKEKENCEKNMKLLNTTKNIVGSFEWMKLQDKSKDSNFFGKSPRFFAGPKSEKRPSPNFYKLNNDWLSKANLTKVSACSVSNFKSVYYH